MELIKNNILELNTLTLEENLRIKLLSHQTTDAIDYYNNFYSMCFLKDLGCGNNVRSLKNHIIVLLVSLSRTICSEKKKCTTLKNLCNEFIVKLERLNNLEDVLSLGQDAITSFASFMKKCHVKCENSIINNAVEFIENNLSEDLSLDLISSNVHVSKNYLSILFQEKTGRKLSQFINELRVEKAKELLNASSFSLNHISDLCGFKTQSYFSTIFKKVTNTSPLEYRKYLINRILYS